MRRLNGLVSIFNLNEISFGILGLGRINICSDGVVFTHRPHNCSLNILSNKQD